MIEPNYMCNYSLIEDKVQLRGNTELAKILKDMVKEKCIHSVNLYEAQEIVRNYCISNYGANFYDKNVEAISFIIENEYCSIERNKRPSFDMNGYIEDMQNGVMY